MKWLVYGYNGWIGNMVIDLLSSMNETVLNGVARADNEVEVEKELQQLQPDRVVSLIGRTYGPGFTTIDYLEQKGKLVENLKDNLYGPVVLAMLCKRYNIHFTYLGTGCIFNGYEGDTGNGYSESAIPDFFGSSYSTAKGFTDRLMHFFNDSVLNCRIRMPITSDNSGRNFITKITTYKKICSIPNSMTVLPELLPVMLDMAKNKQTGTVNLTNPGLITHNEILEMYKEIVNPEFKWENFTIEEQAQILLAGRSNNLLNTDKLHTLYPNVLPIKESVRNILLEMKSKMNK
ncbi:rhamnose synthesis protein [Fadolivirus algeromassiliense]|jgi:3,5-epimerase/4-reductase|uniref:Rhamnose synthesis protein n=1 Tax=Fadolivirus FV1/VV64 TaxID=3070911 RepID=A0A7D3QTR8_9VIRU|nr:rhamnose synthesis protein [Fadolivirus algeromassiliense]QKF93545.1 rhamnose synthesis protein [Fadolivirus FV1/VV64]